MNRRVAQEADQLADREVAGDDLAGAEPHQQHEEDAGEEHPDGLDGRLPHARARRRPAGPAGTGGRSCARTSRSPPMPRRMRRPATMSVAIEVRSELRLRSICWRRCSGRSSGSAAPTRTGAATSTSTPSCRRDAEHDGRDHQVGDQLRAGPGDDLGQGAELVGVGGGDAQHLAGRRTARQHVAHLRDLAGHHLHGAVEADQPAAHDQRVQHDAEDAADDDHREHQPAHPSRALRESPEDAVVDGTAEDVGAERQRHQPQQAGHRGRGDDLPLLAQHPPQERRRCPGVGIGVGASSVPVKNVAIRGGKSCIGSSA